MGVGGIGGSTDVIVFCWICRRISAEIVSGAVGLSVGGAVGELMCVIGGCLLDFIIRVSHRRGHRRGCQWTPSALVSSFSDGLTEVMLAYPFVHVIGGDVEEMVSGAVGLSVGGAVGGLMCAIDCCLLEFTIRACHRRRRRRDSNCLSEARSEK